MKRKTHAEFMEQVKDRPFDVLDEYITKESKIWFRCRVDGHIWHARPGNILTGYGCPKCAGRCGNDVVSDHGKWLEVDISTSKHPDAIMKIDKADWERIQNEGVGRVSLSKKGYPVARFKGKVTAIHRLIFPNSECVDHIFHDTADNRRSKIRPCTHQQNLTNISIRKTNKSGVAGVAWNKQTNKWQARIRQREAPRFIF